MLVLGIWGGWWIVICVVCLVFGWGILGVGMVCGCRRVVCVVVGVLLFVCGYCAVVVGVVG